MNKTIIGYKATIENTYLNEDYSLNKIFLEDDAKELFIKDISNSNFKIEMEPVYKELAIHDEALKYLHGVRDDLVKRYGSLEFSIHKDEIYDWIRSWGNGGGMSSVQYVFTEGVDEKTTKTIEDYIEHVVSDEYCDAGTAIMFADILNSLIPEVCGGSR